MINLETLKIKIFGRSRRKLLKDMHFLCLEISDNLEDMLEDIDSIQESHNEYMRIMLRVQEQCDEIIKIYESMQKRDEERIAKGITFSPIHITIDKPDNINDVLDRIDKITDGFDKGETDGQ